MTTALLAPALVTCTPQIVPSGDRKVFMLLVWCVVRGSLRSGERQRLDRLTSREAAVELVPVPDIRLA